MKFTSYLICCSILIIFSSCANIERSLVFSTGTTIGLEVAVSPSSEAPVDILIGYKRAEVLFDPIMNDKDTNANKDKRQTYEIRPRAHSVIAKLLGEMKTTGTTGQQGPQAKAGLSVAQWFASGKAAEIIAQNGGAAALTDNPNVAKEVTKAATLISTKGEIPNIVFSLTNQLFQGIKSLSKDKEADPIIREQAEQLYHSMNGSGRVANVPKSIKIYVGQYNKSTNELIYKIVTKPFDKIQGYQRVLEYQSNLSESVEHLSRIRKAIIANSPKIFDETSGTKTEIKETDTTIREELLDKYQEQKETLKNLERSMTTDPQLIAMWRFLGGEK